MADANHCDACNEDFPTSRGLNIHLARVHKEDKSANSATNEAAKSKIQAVLLKSRPSGLINPFLKRLAAKYGDPDIALNDAEAGDIDACVRELSSELDMGDSAAKILPYLPWISILLIGGPIVMDKIGRIEAKGGLATTPDKPKDDPKSADGSRPTLTRKDVQPDGGDP